MTTIETITDEQIEALSTEAGEAVDLEQVAVCDRTLSGDRGAIRACVEAIRDAEARRG